MKIFFNFKQRWASSIENYSEISYLEYKSVLLGNIKVIIPIIVASQIVSNLIKIPLIVDTAKGILDNDNNPTIENSVAAKPPGKKDNTPNKVANKWVNKDSYQDISNWPILFIIKFKEYPSTNHGQIPIKRERVFNLKFRSILKELRNWIADFFWRGKNLYKNW